MRRCFLHAGGHKTGTSALQAFLAENRTELSRLGYLVPASGMSVRGTHHDLVHQAIGLPVREQSRSCLQELALELVQSEAPNVVISSEFIETLAMSQPRHVAGFLAYLQSLNLEVTLVYYFRHQPQLLNSRYAQVVKTFRQDRSFEAFVSHHLTERPFSGLVAAIETPGLRSILRPYNEEVRSRGIVGDFLRCIGMADWQTFGHLARVNESVGPVAVEAARQLMKLIPGGVSALGHQQATRCAKLLRNGLRRAALREPIYCGLSTALAERIEAAYRRQNDAVALRAWGVSWSEAFSGDVGAEHSPNDLAMVEPGAEQRGALDALVAAFGSRIGAVLDDAGGSYEPGLNVTRKTLRRRLRQSDASD